MTTTDIRDTDQVIHSRAHTLTVTTWLGTRTFDDVETATKDNVLIVTRGDMTIGWFSSPWAAEYT